MTSGDLRLYSAEAWAKYTGAAEYNQALHRDYLNHTLVVPTDAVAYQQVEMFVYLVDVPEELGPPHMLSRQHTQSFPAKPNWYPRSAPGADADSAGFVAPTAHPELYDAEESATGPAGTVVAFQPSTFHRGTALSAPRGVRYSMHVNYRPSVAEWAQRHSWVSHSHDPDWYRFVERATPRQLALFGFPPPGHPYWTTDTLAGVAQRYPDLDLSPWQTTS
ncbi:MAG TPA: phytanoyl-CoA dioxygenase family protein [Nocardioidaceae bacterium]|nr:phytanoyl-CoA dioxygenase family protein [Nocardioidaceae bacterium]